MGLQTLQYNCYTNQRNKSSMASASKIKTAFVCRGNTCRSPLCEAIFNEILAVNPVLQTHFAPAKSAGVGTYTDRVSRTGLKIGSTHGLRERLEAHRCTQVDAGLFTCFDKILCMDYDNYRQLQRYNQDAKLFYKVEYLRSYDATWKPGKSGYYNQNVPEIDDPIGAQAAVYEAVYQQCLTCITAYITNTIPNVDLDLSTLKSTGWDRNKKSVIFVCQSNTVRSPFCEAIFNSKLEQFSSVFNPASSGGTHTGWGDVCPDWAISMAKLKKLPDISEHESTQIYDDVFENNDYIICIDEYCVDRLKKKYGKNLDNTEIKQKVLYLGDFGELASEKHYYATNNCEKMVDDFSKCIDNFLRTRSNNQ